jgi:putative transposase
VEFIGDRKAEFGVEPIRAVLSEHGAKLAPSTYYDAAGRVPSRRTLSDADLQVAIARVHAANYGVYGPRKVGLALNREGVPVARCTVERLMRQLQLTGARRGKRIVTTRPDATAARPADLVQRRFRPAAPNRLWVADFTYVPTWSGTVYVAFVIDAYARRILGWRASTSMHPDLVLDTCWPRPVSCVATTTGRDRAGDGMVAGLSTVGPHGRADISSVGREAAGSSAPRPSET